MDVKQVILSYSNSLGLEVFIILSACTLFDLKVKYVLQMKTGELGYGSLPPQTRKMPPNSNCVIGVKCMTTTFLSPPPNHTLFD